MKTSTLLLLLALHSPGYQEAQAQAGAPGWVTTLPAATADFAYFRGDGTDDDLEQAKLKARIDAYRKVVLWREGGHSGPLREGFSLNAGQAEALSTSLEMKLDPVVLDKIEWVADFHSGGEVTAEGGYGKPPFQYYLLVRVHRDQSRIARIGYGISSRFDAVFHSALYPGWGQSRQGRTGEAGFFGFFGTLTALSAGTCYVMQQNFPREAGAEKWYRRQDWGAYQKGALYALGGIYVANLLDALIFGRRDTVLQRIRWSPVGAR